MRDLIDLVSRLSRPTVTESHYDLQRWVRWWTNDKTGKIMRVPSAYDHDSFLFGNLEEFGIDEIDFDDDESKEEILLDMYKQGWQAALYDGHKSELSLRGEASRVSALRRIATLLAREVPFETLAIDLMGTDGLTPVRGVVLDANATRVFLKSGKLD